MGTEGIGPPACGREIRGPQKLALVTAVRFNFKRTLSLFPELSSPSPGLLAFSLHPCRARGLHRATGGRGGSPLLWV